MYTLASPLDIEGDLQMIEGGVDNSSGHTITVSGAFLETGGDFLSGSGTLRFDGGSGGTIISKSTLWDVQVGGIEDTGLVGHWTFDEGTGTETYDMSGNGNMGRLMNMAADDWVKTTPIAGNGWALDFDGGDDYVEIEDDASFKFNAGDDFTFSMWLKRNAISTEQALLGTWPSNDNGYLLWFKSTNKLQINLDTIDILSTGTITDTSSWHHVAVTMNRPTLTFYIDGANDSSGSSSSDVSDAGNLFIGDSGSFHSRFNGLLDDIRIYNRALSAKEVEALAGSGSYTMGSALTVKDDLKISAAKFDPSASGYTLWLSGDFENYGGFNTSGSGNVKLVGAGTQTMTGYNMFYNLTATGTNTITMAHNGVQSVSGSLVLQNITLRSTKAGSGARMTLDGSSGIQTVDTVDVADNDASGGAQIVCETTAEGCTDSGGTTNWNFGAAAAEGGGGIQQFFWGQILWLWDRAIDYFQRLI